MLESRAMQSEEQRVVEEVKRRKQRAWQSGVVKGAFDLYRENLRYYDAGTTNYPCQIHPQISVTNKTKTTENRESSERIEATILGNVYVFTFRKRSTPMDDGVITSGYLDVEYQGQRVMRIDCRCEDDRYAGPSWSPMDVSVFLEGPWVADITSVSADIKYSQEQRNEQARRESKQQELDNLKRNFGLKATRSPMVARKKGFMYTAGSIIGRLLRF
ncbi:MAG: hypothetical protein WA197_02395 [Candidatus Acidiferrales bacterium]